MPSVVNITLSITPSFAWQNAKWWQDPNRRAVIMARFWSHVNRGESEACWLWTGNTNRAGYGEFTFSKKHDKLRVRAHRFAWVMSRSDIPAGLEVCHHCDTPGCVNPHHLFLGTRRENHLDSVRKGRKRAWGLQKLNAEQVITIRARVAAGERHKIIAADFGIARHSVGQIANRKSWAHLHCSSEAPHTSEDGLQ